MVVQNDSPARGGSNEPLKPPLDPPLGSPDDVSGDVYNDDDVCVDEEDKDNTDGDHDLFYLWQC